MSHSLFDLTGRRVLVTGSSQGIGYALARGLAAAGAHVIVNGRDAGKVAKAAAALRAEGSTIAEAAFDVTDADAVEAAVETIERDIGPIDALFNNAGITRRATLTEFSTQDWDAIQKTNVDAVFFVSRAVARHMIGRKRGKIVTTCSVQSQLARGNNTGYAASKGAVAMLTKAMCADLARHGIQVNGIAPGYFDTELTQALVQDKTFSAWVEQRTPAGRWGKVEELVGAAVFLAAPASDFVNGHILYVDGGMTAVV